MIYTILSIIALCAEIALIAFFVYKTFKTKKAFSKKTLWYAVPTFCVTFYLYVVGYVYSGAKFTFLSVFVLIAETLESFVLKVSLDTVLGLTLANDWYYAATAIAVSLMGLTLIASVIGLWGANVINRLKVKKAIKDNREFILGNGESALNYARNNPDAVIVTFEKGKKINELIESGCLVISADIEKDNPWLKKQIERKTASRMHQFIVFNDTAYPYAKLINWFTKCFDKTDDNYFTLHIEATLAEIDVINRKLIDRNTFENICVKSFNKYELLARKVTMDYPLSASVPEQFYDDCRTIKKDKKINVVFAGFGKVNFELAKLMIMQNQFAELSDDGQRFINHPVNYYIFDNEKNRLHSDMTMRLQASATKFAVSDLPVPENIYKIESLEEINVYSADFVKKLDGIVTGSDAFTYIVVSMGDDYENISYAEHLRDIYGGCNIKIFARIKYTQFIGDVDDKIIPFGEEKSLLTREILINETLDELSREINNKYLNRSSSEIADEIKDFNSRPTIERYSNIYHAASIFFKVGLLGLRFVKPSDSEGLNCLSKTDLLSLYKGYSADVNYGKYFKVNVWSMLGFSEHSRWFMQYLLKGFRPMPFAEIKVTGKGESTKVISKNISERKHCCLTDYYSLDIYHKHLLQLYNDNGANKTIDDVETYKYDYMFINESYDDMIKRGYVLVKA